MDTLDTLFLLRFSASSPEFMQISIALHRERTTSFSGGGSTTELM